MPATVRRSAPPHPLAETLFLIALVVFALAAGCERVWDGDVPWHITAGDWMLRHHSLPTEEVWSSEGADGFTPTSWLFQLFVAVLHRLGGFEMLSILSGGIAVTIALLLHRSCARESRGALIGLLLVLTLFVVQRRIRVRPEELSMLFLLCTMILWDSERPGRFLPIAVLFAVWANTHTLFVLGPLLLGCGLAGRAIQRRSVDRRDWLLGLAAIAATAATPMPVAFLRVPLLAFSQARGTQEVFARGFTELAPTLRSLGSPDVLVYLGLTFACALLLILRWSGTPWHHRLWFLLTLPLGLMAVRNIGLATVACAYLILRRLPPRPAGNRLSLASGAILLILGAFGYANGTVAALTQRVPRPGTGLQEDQFPFALAKRIAGAPGTGAILPLDFASASVFMLTASPQDDPRHKVFIDARSDVHGPGEYVRLFSIRTAMQESPEAVDRMEMPSGIGFIVVDFMDIEILYNLAGSARYRLWYLDRNHACFVPRNASGEPPNLADFDAPLLADGAILPGSGYRKSWSNLHPVATHLRLGLVFGALGETRLAIRYLEAAEALLNGDAGERRIALAMAWLELADTDGTNAPEAARVVPALRARRLAETSGREESDPLTTEIRNRASEHVSAAALAGVMAECPSSARADEASLEAAARDLLESDARAPKRLATGANSHPLLPVLAGVARGDWAAVASLLRQGPRCPAASEIAGFLGSILGWARARA